MSRLRSLLLGLALFALGVTGASALSVVERSFDELVELADHVVVGTVEGLEGRLGTTSAGRQYVTTRVSLTQLDVVKGTNPGDSYVLEVAGGVAGGVAQVYPGLPEFKLGERYVLFIRGNRQDFFPVVGIQQGLFKVEPDNGRSVVRNADDQPVLGIQQGRVIAGVPAAGVAPLSLEAFLGAVRVRLPVQVEETQP